MSIQWEEAREYAAPDRVYSLATVLNPGPNRSIRNRRTDAAAMVFAVVCLAALSLFL